MLATQEIGQENLNIITEKKNRIVKDGAIKDIAKFIAISGGITSITIATIFIHPKQYIDFSNGITKESQAFSHYITSNDDEFLKEHKIIPFSFTKK